MVKAIGRYKWHAILFKQNVAYDIAVILHSTVDALEKKNNN